MHQALCVPTVPHIAPDDGDNALSLLLGAHMRRARPRRVPANVEDVCAGGRHAESALHDVRHGRKLPAVAEAVWRDVENAHHVRAALLDNRVECRYEKVSATCHVSNAPEAWSQAGGATMQVGYLLDIMHWETGFMLAMS